MLAVIQALAVVLRIALGRWSDVLGDRIGPLRAVGLVAFATLAATAAVFNAPTGVVVAALVVAGGTAMSWNGLSFAAAAELAGRERSGAAIGSLVALAPLLGSAMLSGGRVAATAQGR